MLIRKKFELTLFLVLGTLILAFLMLSCFTLLPTLRELDGLPALFRRSTIPPMLPIWLKLIIFAAGTVCFFWAFINLCTFRPRVLVPMLKATRFCEELGNGRYPAPLAIRAEENAEMNELLRSLNTIRDRLLSSSKRLRSSHTREAEARRISENNADLKSMLIARIAPEVRSPLNNAAGFAELLQQMDALQGAPGKEYIEGIRRSLTRMLRYLERIQKIGTFGQSGTELAIRTFRTEELLQQLRDQNSSHLADRALTLQTPYLPEMPEYLRTDQERLLQLLSLMVRSVARASGTGEVLRCLCVKTPDGVEFQVSDTGKVPCREELSALYSRLHKDTAITEIGDAGTAALGMLFIDAQSALFGGRLTAHRSEEASNEFVLFFSSADIAADVPRDTRPQTFYSTDMPRQSMTQPLPEEESDENEYSVLIGEEDDDGALMLERLLQNSRFQTCRASGAEALLNSCAERKFDAVVLSGSLPCRNLHQLIRQILQRTADPHFPIMILSNEDPALNRKELNRAGARCVLLKPLDFPLMVRQLRGLCRRD